MTRRVPEVYRNEIQRAYQRGDDTADTAKDFGVSKSFPTKAAKRAGIPLRRPRQEQTKRDNQ